MADFDPAKEAINLSKHRVSLARWVDLEIQALVRDDRFDYGEPRFRVYGLLDGQPRFHDAERCVRTEQFAAGSRKGVKALCPVS
jgi:uncharacterized DUF497 family protein